MSEREARRSLGRAPQARSFLRAKRAARDENVQAKRADFLFISLHIFNSTQYIIFCGSWGSPKHDFKTNLIHLDLTKIC